MEEVIIKALWKDTLQDSELIGGSLVTLGYGINHKVLRSEIGHGFGYGRSIGPAHHNNYGGYHNNKASLTAINAAALQAAHQINSLDRVASYSFAGNRDVGNYGLY